MISQSSITEKVGTIAKKYNIEKIDLFGSFASGTQTEKSDIDFLVKFSEETPSIFKVMGLKSELEKSLAMPVDIVTYPIVHPEKLTVRKVTAIYEK